MTEIRGGVAGPDGLGGAYQNEVETDRAAWWYALGGAQGVIEGFTVAGVAGQMSVDVAAGAALLSERDGAGNLQDRGYLVWADTVTRVTFGAASVSARNDALVAAFVDVEDGPVGTGGLAVGAHLVVVPGVSGTTTPRTDAQITAFLGRGGWVRLADVPVASTDTQINMSTVVAPLSRDARLPFLYAERTSQQSIANGVDVVANMTLVSRIGDIGYSAGVVTINRRGVYQFVGGGSFAANTTGTRYVYLWRNGVRIGQRVPLQTDTQVEGIVTAIVQCEAGDTVSLMLWQTSGAALLTNNWYPSPSLSVVCQQFT